MDRAISGRKLVLSCAVVLVVIAAVGLYFVIRETTRLRERRETLLKQSGIEQMHFSFLRGAEPIRVSPMTETDSPIAYWEVYSLSSAFEAIVTDARVELERVDPAIQPANNDGKIWEHNGKRLQVLILANSSYPEFAGQGNRIVFDDLPPLVTRTNSVVVRINYKRY